MGSCCGRRGPTIKRGPRPGGTSDEAKKMTDYNRFESLQVTIDDAGIARVAINRPETLNAVTMEVHKDLEDVWLALDQDARVKVVILTGEGRAFVAGGDLKRMAERLGTAEGNEHILSVMPKARRLLSSIVDFHKPLIAAVNGDAIGLGATLALFCDIIIISNDARIGDPHVHVGVSAGDGGAIIWPLLIGPAKAKEFLMRGHLIKGAEAERINLVNHAVPAEEVMPLAQKIAGELAALPPWAVRYSKSTVNIMVRQYLNLMMDASMAAEALTMTTSEHAERVRAFVARSEQKQGAPKAGE
jgi:enoyl-CoA hydratase/carnithine racemase